MGAYASNTLSLGSGSTANLVLISNGTVSASSIKVAPVPGLTNGVWFGDGDSGFSEVSDGSMLITLNNVAKYGIGGTWLSAWSSLGFGLRGGEAATNYPNICPRYSQSLVGIGYGGSNTLSFYGGGSNALVSVSGGVLRAQSFVGDGSGLTNLNMGESNEWNYLTVHRDYETVLGNVSLYFNERLYEIGPSTSVVVEVLQYAFDYSDVQPVPTNLAIGITSQGFNSFEYGPASYGPVLATNILAWSNATYRAGVLSTTLQPLFAITNAAAYPYSPPLPVLLYRNFNTNQYSVGMTISLRYRAF
jgi:hypothetical protein